MRDLAWVLFRDADATPEAVRAVLSARFSVRDDGEGYLIDDGVLRVTNRDAAVTVEWIAKQFEAFSTKAGARRAKRLRDRGFDRCIQLAFPDLARSDSALIDAVHLSTTLTRGWSYFRWNGRYLTEP
ncbi:MAG TPA: hypothetical protein VGM90_35910 [Kofleriaceae bacterium]|jgi:hypothetical protein